MKSPSSKRAASARPQHAGANLRSEVERHGTRLAEALTGLLGTVTPQTSGPQALADLLGITVVTASRLLRAIDQADPVAVVQQLPGTNPLRQVIDSAVRKGASRSRASEARKAVTEFDEFVRSTAGHRSSLDAMLTDWLPQGRREFQVRRRQAAYKAISELRGVSCNLDLATIVVHPSETPGAFDLLSIQGTFGVDRIRPDAIVRFGSRRLPAREPSSADHFPVSSSGQFTDRQPLNLDGEPASDGLHTVRLDEFCSSSPAPLVAQRFGEEVQYTLGSTGFGPQSSVDFVMAEVNRGEYKAVEIGKTRTRPYFYQIPAVPTRAMLFDLLLHEDVWPGAVPELMVYDTSFHGPDRAGAPERDVDLLQTTEDIVALGSDPARRRFVGFPRYLELLDHAFGKLGWRADSFRTFRLQVSYPLHATQSCMVLREATESD